VYRTVCHEIQTTRLTEQRFNGAAFHTLISDLTHYVSILYASVSTDTTQSSLRHC
jgi:hypothetical protein